MWQACSNWKQHTHLHNQCHIHTQDLNWAFQAQPMSSSFEHKQGRPMAQPINPHASNSEMQQLPTQHIDQQMEEGEESSEQGLKSQEESEEECEMQSQHSEHGVQASHWNQPQVPAWQHEPGGLPKPIHESGPQTDGRKIQSHAPIQNFCAPSTGFGEAEMLHAQSKNCDVQPSGTLESAERQVRVLVVTFNQISR